MKALNKLPKAKYDVELISKHNSHFYKDKEQDIVYRGVTGALGIIAKDALIAWSKKVSLLNAKRQMLLKPYKLPETRGFRHYEDWVDEIIEEAAKEPDKIKNKAAGKGTEAHAFIDKIILGQEPGSIPEDIRNPVLSFKAWFDKSDIKIIAGDTKVLSKKHKFGGSLDAIGVQRGHTVLLDWKSGNRIYTTHHLQVSAYAQALKETYGVKAEHGYIVRVGSKMIEHEQELVPDFKKPLKAFLNALELQKIMSELENKGE